MAKHDTHSPQLDSLNLSWPHAVNYHVDKVRPDASSPSGDVAKSSDIGSQEPVTTYNGVPRERVRNAQPLVGKEIRVLDLKGGARGTPLLGSLRRVRLSEYDGYEPLSYTWEDQDTVYPGDDSIEDDVHPALFLLDTDHYLDLTSNCARALNSIRKLTTDRAIWVDSICVNQDDQEERSHQVDLMKEIYATAFTVLIYLGRESSEAQTSSRMAMKLLGQPDRLQLSHQLDQCEITSLKRLFERHYFQRMWIVQEVVLAQNLELHCGPDISYVSKFAGKPLEAILGVQVTPPWLRHSKQAFRKPTKYHTISQAEQLLGLVFDTALCDCKDDRDRIFALFSLLNPGDEERLRADYNLSPAQVYSGLAAYLATNGLLWGVLMLAPRLGMSSCPGLLPSWVPDWNNLSEIGLHTTNLLQHLVSRSRNLGLSTLVGVASSGVITLRGMLLGSVTNAGYIEDDLFRHDTIGRDRRLTTELFNDRWNSSNRYEHKSIWTLAKANHNESLDSWGCHFKFFTRCNRASNAQHRAFMLPDYSTVLILRPHDSFRDEYTLVEIGKPLVRADVPKDWNSKTGGSPHLQLRCLKPMNYRQQYHWDIVLGSKEAFPRLADFPRLWSHNPLLSTESLTQEAIQGIQRINITLPSLLKQWQEHIHVGMQILRDKTRLGQLLDEVKSLGYEDYDQKEKAAKLHRVGSSTPEWSLVDFLSLFIGNPHVQLHGHQLLDEIDELETAALKLNELKMDPLLQLMQWARVTCDILELLSAQIYTGFHWTGLLTDEDLFIDAQTVGGSQISRESHGRDRTSFVLGKILCQLHKEANPEFQEDERPQSENQRCWDWTRFNSILKQRSCFIGHIRPDVEKIQADPHYFKPSFGVLAAQQVFAAHGFDPSKEQFTQIPIR